MDRAVIEHPQFMPAELKERPDLTLGKHTGRIWRVVPDTAKDRPAPPHLSDATTEDLVDRLGHPNIWWRRTAQRLLLERQDAGAIEPLVQTVREDDRPLARLHAAWLLESFGKLDADLVRRLLDDPHPRVREHAVRLAEPYLAKDDAIRQRVMGLADDPDARLRFQVALSLGGLDDDRIVEPLARIALAGAGDRWTRLAVESGVPTRAGALLRTILKTTADDPRAADDANRLALIRELTALVGARRDPKEVENVLETLLTLDADGGRLRMAGLDGLAEGMGRSGKTLGDLIATLPESGTLAERLNALFVQAARVAGDEDREIPARLDAIRLLAHAPWDVAGPHLVDLLQNESRQEVRVAAVRAIAAQRRRRSVSYSCKTGARTPPPCAGR